MADHHAWKVVKEKRESFSTLIGPGGHLLTKLLKLFSPTIQLETCFSLKTTWDLLVGKKKMHLHAIT